MSYLDALGCGTGHDDLGRVQVFDLGSPDAPLSLGIATLPSDAYTVAVADPARVLVATMFDGLQQVDFTDPPNAGICPPRRRPAVARPGLRRRDLAAGA